MTGASHPLPQERPVQLWVEGALLHTFYCTPRDLAELAVGFLSDRGLLRPGCLPTVTQSQGEPWSLRAELDGPPLTPPEPVPWRPVPLTEVSAMAREAMEQTPLRRQSGGVHAAALCWQGGLLVREDVARHNAVDKAVGAGIIRGVDPAAAVLFTTGRLSHEMLAKAARLGIPVAATMKYPTDLGVALASRKGMCVVGMVLSPAPVVYSGGWRLCLE